MFVISYHVPEVKIISHESVRPGEKTALLIKLTNPTAHEMQVLTSFCVVIIKLLFQTITHTNVINAKVCSHSSP